jgi:hypothetical protein
VLTIDALIETTGSVGLGARVQQGGCGDNYANGGYFFDITDKGFSLFFSLSRFHNYNKPRPHQIGLRIPFDEKEQQYLSSKFLIY